MQLAHTDLTSGDGIDGLFVHDLPTASRRALRLLEPPSNFDCSTGTLAEAQAAGAIKPGTTLGDLDIGQLPGHVTIQQLLLTVLGPNSEYKNFVNFGDLVGLFIDNNDVPWESVSPDVLAIFDPNRPHMSMDGGLHGARDGDAVRRRQGRSPGRFRLRPGLGGAAAESRAELHATR